MARAAHNQPTLRDRLDALAQPGGRASLDDALRLLVELAGGQGGELKPGARDACLALLVRLLPHAGEPTRAAAASALATLDDAPANLLLALAREPIAVAAPVLRRARGLTTFDLTRIASEASVAHLRAIADRESVPEPLTGLLLLRGDRPTLIACLQNPRARLSRATLAALAERAGVERDIRDALVQRRDLPETVVERLWPVLDVKRRACLLAAGWTYGPDAVDEVMSEALLFARDDADSDLLGTVEDLSGSLTLDPGIVLNLLHGTYERGAVVLARHAGLNEPGLLRLLCGRARLASVPAVNMQSALRAFAATDADEAAAILKVLARLWPGGPRETKRRR